MNKTDIYTFSVRVGITAMTTANHLPLTNQLIEKLKEVLTEKEFDMLATVLEEKKGPTSEEILSNMSEYTPDQILAALLDYYADLDEVEIGQSDAAKKYGTTDTSILNWQKQGIVRRLRNGSGRGNQVILNERDVAVRATMNKLLRKGKSGPIKGWKPPKIAC